MKSTALLLDIKTGLATCVGESYAFICNPLSKPEVCQKNTPLTYKDMNCVLLNGTANSVYSFDTFQSKDMTSKQYKNVIIDGVFKTEQFDGVPPGNANITDD